MKPTLVAVLKLPNSNPWFMEHIGWRGVIVEVSPYVAIILKGYIHQQQQVLTNFFQFPDMFASSSHVGQILC